MARFDTGVPAGALEQFASGVFAILRLPLLSLLERMPGARSFGLRSYLRFLGNAAWRVLHIEYASSLDLGDGVTLAPG